MYLAFFVDRDRNLRSHVRRDPRDLVAAYPASVPHSLVICSLYVQLNCAAYVHAMCAAYVSAHLIARQPYARGLGSGPSTIRSLSTAHRVAHTAASTGHRVATL